MHVAFSFILFVATVVHIAIVCCDTAEKIVQDAGIPPGMVEAKIADDKLRISNLEEILKDVSWEEAPGAFEKTYFQSTIVYVRHPIVLFSEHLDGVHVAKRASGPMQLVRYWANNHSSVVLELTERTKIEKVPFDGYFRIDSLSAKRRLKEMD